jgi:hypothetical protein
MHRSVLSTISIVFPAEDDSALGKGYQPLIGYGDAVRVVGEIFQDILRAAEWAFDVDHPVMLMHIPEKAAERSLIRQWSK